MSHVREISEVLDLCEEQGFRVQKLQRDGGWRVWPKSSEQQPVVIHDGRSRISNTKYMNTRSALRRIGVKFPEFEERKAKTKEVPPMQNRPTLTAPIAEAARVSNKAPEAAPTPQVKRTPAEVLERLKRASEDLELASGEMVSAIREASETFGPLIAMGELLNKIRG